MKKINEDGKTRKIKNKNKHKIIKDDLSGRVSIPRAETISFPWIEK